MLAVVPNLSLPASLVPLHITIIYNITTILTLVSHEKKLRRFLRNDATLNPVLRGIISFVETTNPLPAL